MDMFPSASNDAAKKTPTASRSFARRTMPTPRRATTAHSITIKLNLRRTGSEKNEYRPENHWNVRYQSQQIGRASCREREKSTDGENSVRRKREGKNKI